MILAIDPGCEQSAYVVYDRGKVKRWGKVDNHSLLDICDNEFLQGSTVLAIESVASYGMRVGQEVFDTCVWSGRYIQRWKDIGGEVLRIFRKEVCLHICHSPRANDSNIRLAIIDRYGPGKSKAIGTKKEPGPLYGMKADCWQALGVAITADEVEF